MGKGGHSTWIIYNRKRYSLHVDHIYNGEKVVIPSFHVDHIQWEKVVIPSGSYIQWGKGGDSIIPCGSYNIQWEKVVIPSFHVDHIIYNGKRWSFHHSMWIIYNGKRWVIPSGTYTMGKDNHFTWIIYTMGKRW